MKNSLYIFFFAFLISSCKPTSNIITSKEIAEKKGIYSKPIAENLPAAKTDVKKKRVAVIKPVNKNLTTSKTYNINVKNESDINVDDENTSYLTSQLINAASDNLGVNYRSGGTTKEGFDCSGLIYSTFKKFDIELPRSSYEMAEKGRQIAIENAKKGDLIFFYKSRTKTNKPCWNGS